MANEEYFTYDEACRFLDIPKKYLENYAKVGQEITPVRVGRRKLLVRRRRV